MPPRAAFLARFAARFSFMVLTGSFLVCFLLSMPLLIVLPPGDWYLDHARKTNESPAAELPFPTGLA
jgi:hypothetical protein